MVAAFIENEEPLEFPVNSRLLLPQGIRCVTIFHGG